MTWPVAAVALVVLTWPVAQFAVMVAVILLPGMAADRARARWRRATDGEDDHD